MNRLKCLMAAAAVACPLAVSAQQAEQVRRIGMLMGYAESDPDWQANVAASASCSPAQGAADSAGR